MQRAGEATTSTEEEGTGAAEHGEVSKGGRGTEGRDLEAGMACLEGPDAVRVLLVDRRLLGRKPGPREAGAASTAADAGGVVGSAALGEPTARSREQGVRTTQGGVTGEGYVGAGEASLVRGGISAGGAVSGGGGDGSGETAGEASTAHPLVEVLVSLARRRSQAAPHSGASGRGLPSSTPSKGEEGVKNGHPRETLAGLGDWFSSGELCGELSARETGDLVPGEVAGDDAREGGTPSEASPARLLPRAPAPTYSQREAIGGVAMAGTSGYSPEVAPVAEEWARACARAKGPDSLPVERPFPEIEVSNLENLQGDLRVTPNR